MKELSTDEGNKLIAEFMGEETIFHKGAWKWKSKHNGILPMKYDSDWSWLMPVVEKIENLKNEQIGFGYVISVDMGKDWCGIKFNDFQGRIILAKSVYGNKILSVWQAIVAFIQWYNDKIKNTPSGPITL